MLCGEIWRRTGYWLPAPWSTPGSISAPVTLSGASVSAGAVPIDSQCRTVIDQGRPGPLALACLDVVQVRRCSSVQRIMSSNSIAIKLLENDSSNLLLKFKPCFHFVLIAQNTSVNIF